MHGFFSMVFRNNRRRVHISKRLFLTYYFVEDLIEIFCFNETTTVTDCKLESDKAFNITS